MKELMYWGDMTSPTHEYSDIRASNASILMQMYSFLKNNPDVQCNILLFIIFKISNTII
jgi:hypothetical protein